MPLTEITPTWRDTAWESAASARSSALDGFLALRQGVEQDLPVLGSRVRLRRDRAHAGANPWDAIADARHAGRDGDTDLAGPRIDRGDGKRVELERVARANSPRSRFLGDETASGRGREPEGRPGP